MRHSEVELHKAVEEHRRGRFSAVIDRLGSSRNHTPEQTVILAEALELTGQWDQAEVLVERLLGGRIGPVVRGRALVIRAAIRAIKGDVDAAQRDFAEAVSTLRETNAIEEACEALLRELSCLSDLRVDARLTELAETARNEVVRVGDRRILTTYHVAAANFCAATEQLGSAEAHVLLARSQLKSVDNVWLYASVSLAESGIAFLRSDLGRAVRCAAEAAEASRVSGHRWCSAAAATNLAFLLTRTGRAQEARKYLDVSRKLAKGVPVLEIGALDNAAQLALLDGDRSELASLLRQTESLDSELVGTSWYRLALTQTRARLARAVESWDEYAELSARGADLARARHARTFECVFLAYSSEAHCRLHNTSAAVTVLQRGFSLLPAPAPAAAAELHRVLAVVLAALGKPKIAKECIDRACEVVNTIGDAVLGHEVLATREELKLDSIGQTEWDEPALQILSLLTLAAERLQVLKKIGSLGAACGVADVMVQPEHPSALETSSTFAGTRRAEKVGFKARATNDVLDQLRLAGLQKLAEAAIAFGERARDEATSQSGWKVTGSEAELFCSQNMQQVLNVAGRIARTNIPILITGETGSGKEVLAQFIHKASGRASHSFVTLNCSAIPKELLESQLFGHRKGAFTGATESFPGIVRSAAHGTLFLDEIADLPVELQPKLLRFLETGEIQPLGSSRTEEVEVRIIAATHGDIPELVREGRFRSDLYYRLNGIHLAIPPLRNRREEIPGLVRAFVKRFSEEFQKGSLDIAAEALEHLLLYPWPGNVRQLSAEIRRAAVLAERDGTITTDLFSAEVASYGFSAQNSDSRDRDASLSISLDQPLPLAIAAVERALIQHSLGKVHGRMEDAAKLLGISRKGLFLKRRRYGIRSMQEH